MSPNTLENGFDGGGARRIPELDGLRGIAILLVLAVHFGDFTPPSGDLFVSTVRVILAAGWVGVDLFFVLSGYLITNILLGAKGSPHYFRSFYMRRALRILPLYYLALAGYFFAYLPVAHALHQPDVAHQSEQIWYWLYAANWRIGFDPYAALGISHFWTLAIEEQFYLVWPLIVLMLPEAGLASLCLAIWFGVLGMRGLPVFQAMRAQYPEFLYTLTPFRADTLATGALFAVILRNSRLKLWAVRYWGWALGTGLLITFAAVAAARSVRPFSAEMGLFGYSGVALVCAVALFQAVTTAGSNDRFARLLRQTWLRRFGKYSYAIYVWHWPVSIGLIEILRRTSWGLSLGGALLSVVAGASLSYGLGVLSWNLMEKHFLRWKPRFPF